MMRAITDEAACAMRRVPKEDEAVSPDAFL